MCDYSLFSEPNRLAKCGESLEVFRFPTGAIGLASPPDIQARRDSLVPHPAGHPWWSWSSLRDWLTLTQPAGKPVCAVCIPPGARLLLRDIPKGLQKEYEVHEEAEVSFSQIGADANRFRDAIRFASGRDLLLQRLHEGQRVEVLDLGSSEPEELFHYEESRPRSFA